MSFLTIKPSTLGDIDKIMGMFDNSRRIMRANGNDNQWINGYPSRDLVINDIHNGHSFIVTSREDVVGTFAFIIGRDQTYGYIENGKWENDLRPYGTLHRIACAASQHGIFKTILDWCRRQVTSIRIDTHKDNSIMLHLMGKHGFDYRGIIYIADGSSRQAFQMLNTRTLCEPLKDYIEKNILPQYAAFDSAHRQNHAQTVIDNSLELASHYNADKNMVYTIAAYHDLGLCEGRDRHHIVSGQILMNDKRLSQWFSESDLSVMAEAIEDHRASSDNAPRSIYGKIVAEADRDIEPMKIIQRTVQYGMSHYPELEKEAQWQRTLEHLHEKYAEGGYLKLWLPESDNAARLAELRRIIADKTELRACFEFYYATEKGETDT